jgi:hypothetical protein
MTKLNFYICLVFISFFIGQKKDANAQGLSYQPKGSFSIDIGIPTSERNIAFSNILEGLFNGGLGYQYNIYKGLTVGAGAKYSFFTNDRFALKQTVGKGGLHIPSVYLKLGYEKFTTDRFSINISARSGYANLISVNDSSKALLGKPFMESVFFVEPQLELVLTSEKNDPNAFSLMLGYAVYFAEYRPEYQSRIQFTGFLPEHSKGLTRFFSLGFGYRYYFGLN